MRRAVRPILTVWPAPAMVAMAAVGGAVSLFSAGGFAIYPLRLAFLVLGPLLFWHALQSRPAWRADRLTQWVAILTLAWGTVSIAWSPDRALGIRSLVILATSLTVTLWAIRYIHGRETRLDFVLLSWLAVSTVTASLAVLEIWRGEYLFENVDAEKVASIERFSNRLGWLPPRVFNLNWNSFAFVNSLGAIAFLGLALTPGPRSRRAWAGAVGLLQILLIVSSASRAATAGVLATCLLFALLLLLRRLRIRVAIAAAVGGLLVGLVALAVRTGVSRYLGMLTQVLVLKSRAQDPLGSRTSLYRDALSAMLDSAGLGHGLGAAATVLAGNRVTAYHHHFMQLGAELGVFILGIHLLMHSTIVVRLYSGRHHPRFGTLALALAATHLTLPLLLMGPSGVFVEPLYWLWLGVSAATTVVLQPSGAGPRFG